MSKVCVGVVGGVWIVGEWDGITMTAPRLYLISKDEHGIGFLPGMPESFMVNKFDLLYEIDGDIVDLYRRHIDETAKGRTGEVSEQQ